jgi:hypothetical protein
MIVVYYPAIPNSRIISKTSSGFLAVRDGGLCLCSCGFNRQASKFQGLSLELLVISPKF